jgi:GTP cyclohydrolase I
MMDGLIRDLLKELGEDPYREGLTKTPERVAKALGYLTSGYGKTVAEVLNGAIFTEPYDEMVVVKDIEVYSLCEHHLLPFFGKAHVAYLPQGGKVVGLSKLARTVDVFARRPQVQERLTTQIADALMNHIDAAGVAVVIEAEHMCMKMRGVGKPRSLMVTSALRGVFKTNPASRAEVMSLMMHQRT